jgi:hypothetical protein
MSNHIHTPEDPRVFVFGSNLKGIHGAGAALYAYEKLGAVLGQSFGLMPDESSPRSFALPTCRTPGDPLSLREIEMWVNVFFAKIVDRPERFFVSAIACGYAGYTEHVIAPMFKDAPMNCDLPPGWRC